MARQGGTKVGKLYESQWAVSRDESCHDEA
jgi:hypothetical protein